MKTLKTPHLKPFNSTRIKFLEKMFDIILDNLIPPKYKFKLFHVDDPIPELEELKKISKMSKYQLNDYVKEKRITMVDQFYSQFEASVKQYNFATNYNRIKLKEIRQQLEEAVKLINKGRNISFEALNKIDSLNYLATDLDIFSREFTAKAAKFFAENKLGFDYTPEKLWKFKKIDKELEINYDPRLATSKRTSMPTKPKEWITYKVVVNYHEPLSEGGGI